MRTAPDVLFKSLADPSCALRAVEPRWRTDGADVDGYVERLATRGVKRPLRKHAGLVRARHKRRQTHYAAQPRALAPLVGWMRRYCHFWQLRFDQLEDLLKRMGP